MTKVTAFALLINILTDFFTNVFTNELVKPSRSSPPGITTEEEPGTSLEVGQHWELRFLDFGATGQLYEPIAQRVV